MAIRKIARLGHPVLRTPAVEVPVNLISSDDIQRIISDMHETVLDADGAGLAAPQVFVSKQIVLLDLDDENGMQVWINPKITPLTEDVMIGFEGCLSVPNMRGAVARYAKITVEGWNDKGEQFSIELEDHPAVVAQHECDHLQGILYTDRVEPFTLTFLPEYKKYGHLLWRFITEDDASDDSEGEQ
jgi:peptide deformylase